MPIVSRILMDDGVSLSARHRGGAPQSPPAVVLVHGLASTSRLWDGVAGELSATGTPVTALDLRGHGESDAPETGYDTQTAVDDVRAAVTRLGAHRVVLAGQSWGGNVVLRLAAQSPSMVSGLVLVDGGWIDLQRSFPTWDSALDALTPPSIDGMPADEFRDVVSTSLAEFPEGALEAAASVVRVRADGTIERRLPIGRHLQILRSLWEDDPSEWYSQVTCPVTLVPAVADGTVPEPVLLAEAALSDVRLHPQVGAHHDVHLQRPAEIATEIRSLLP